ncbi:MAG: hypothetical protein MZW92_13530 [Comamonadaceae bacterium]|nr:hypothetical protein [Comamonadaceae bacterium]
MKIAIIGSRHLRTRRAHALRDDARITLYEAACASAATRTRSTSRSTASPRGRHRLPGLQRAHLSQPDPRCSPNSACRRRRATCRSPSASRAAAAAASSGRAPTSTRVFAQRRNLLSPALPRACCATSCASTAQRHAARRRAPADTAACRSASSSTAHGYGDDRSATGTCCRWRRRSGRARRDQMLRLPARHLRPLLPQPRPAAGRRTGRSGCTVRGGARQYVRRIAARLPDVRLATPVRRRQARRAARQVVRRRPARRRALRRRGAGLPQRPGAGAAGRRRRRRARRARRRSATSPTAPCCTPTPRCCRRAQGVWSAWNYASDGRAEPEHVPVSLPADQPAAAAAVRARRCCVSLNPIARAAPRTQVIAEFDYAHPVFDARRDRRAAARSPTCRAGAGTWFCGRLDRLRLPRGRPEVGACGGPGATCARAGRAAMRRRRPPDASEAASTSDARSSPTAAADRLRPRAATRAHAARRGTAFAYPHASSCGCRCAPAQRRSMRRCCRDQPPRA